MNNYVQNFQQMGANRDQAMFMIFGVCLAFVLSYLLFDVYKFLPPVWQERGRGLLIFAFGLFYFASWFAFLLQ